MAAHHLNRQFAVAAPNQVWAGGLTSIWTGEGWLYLAVLLDLYSRAVIGGAGGRLTGELTQQTFAMTFNRRPPKPCLLHHSEQGRQYAATAYQRHLRAAGMSGRRSRRGNCGDNACVESFFGTLKRELIHHRHYRTGEEARRRSLNTSRCFILGSLATPPSTLRLQQNLKRGRQWRNSVSTNWGKVIPSLDRDLLVDILSSRSL